MIPLFDPTRDYARRRNEYLAAVDRVLASGQLVLGPETETFEHEFATHVGADYGVGMNSGTDALTLALLALEVRIGDEWLMPALTAPATAAAVRAAGAIPRFVDVCPDTLTIDVAHAESLINRRTRGLIPVHLYGCPVDVAAVVALAERHSLTIIEDCAQAHGTTFSGRHVGSFGRIGCFSFYPTKNLGAFGDAGMCVTNDRRLDQRLRRLRYYGLDADRVAQADGRNSRLDEMQAALLRVKLRYLDANLARRRQIAQRYRRGLCEAGVQLPPDTDGHAYHQFVVRVRDRDAWRSRFAMARIETGIHYPRPLHLMPVYQSLGYRGGDLPNVESAADEVVSLPIFAELTDAEIDHVCTVAREPLTV
jgi:dTDP-4-amino-4,6-dideoxygalactose transaminase